MLPPEPDLRSLGDARRAKALIAGDLRFAGSRVTLPPDGPLPFPDIWAAHAPIPGFDAARHGFDWLDDLAALSTPAARDCALQWHDGWAQRYGRGGGRGWTAAIAARRMIRLIDLGAWLAPRQDDPARQRLGRTIQRDARFLARRLKAVPPGAEGIEVASVLIVAVLAMQGPTDWLSRAVQRLDAECGAAIGNEGGLGDRNPQSVADALWWLVRAADALAGENQRPGRQHAAAIGRMAPTLRALRHADGHLCRFQGCDGGDPVRLDAALALSGATGRLRSGRPLGFARLARGRTTVLVDAAAPLLGPGPGENSHASTLAFELSSGRRPLIVSCGSGSGFGPDWHRAARATPSHSTLAVDGRSSARLGTGRGDRDLMVEGPGDVEVDIEEDAGGLTLVAGHNGYAGRHGLIHVRRLDLDARGRRLSGEDVLTAVTTTERVQFEKAVAASRPSRSSGEAGLEYTLRFHLHPDVEAVLDRTVDAARLSLPSGEAWEFRHSGPCTIRLDPSVYLENTRPAPRACQQIVLSGRTSRFVTQIDWTLEKTADTPDFLRDVSHDAAGLDRDSNEGPGAAPEDIS